MCKLPVDLSLVCLLVRKLPFLFFFTAYSDILQEHTAPRQYKTKSPDRRCRAESPVVGERGVVTASAEQQDPREHERRGHRWELAQR